MVRLGLVVATHLAVLGAGQQCSQSSFLQNTCKPFGAYKKIATADAAACCGACANEGAACGSWVFSTKHAPSCHLHPDGLDGTKTGSCTSGAGTPAPSPPPSPPAPPLPSTSRNLLYIIVDDLRAELTYADKRKGLVTPNIDALAKQGTVFTRAYVQLGVCSPSRNSLLTGRRPDTTQVWNFKNSFRDVLGNSVSSWPGAFKNAGYTTLGMGKVYHPNHPKNDDGDLSWSTEEFPYFHPKNYAGKISDAPDNTFQDGMTTDHAIESLQSLAKAKSSNPFFMAVGLHKPHIPWVMPQRFVDMQVPVDQTDIAKVDHAPTGYCNVSFYRCPGGLKRDKAVKNAAPLPWEPAPKSAQQQARQLYRAAVSWTDYNVGRILKELDALNMTQNTAIVFHGDHGWHLGEHGSWCKQSNFELVARVPLIVSVPWMPQSHGQRSGAIVEMVDLMPTTLDLMGVTDRVADFKDLEGLSFLPILKKPSTAESAWKNASFTQYPRCKGTKDLTTAVKSGNIEPWDFPTNNACTGVESSDFDAMGLSIRTLEWRYTLWLKWNGRKLAPMWDQAPVGEELYTHVGDTGDDTDSFENENLAAQESYKAVKAELQAQLKAGWKAAMPSFEVSTSDSLLV